MTLVRKRRRFFYGSDVAKKPGNEARGRMVVAASSSGTLEEVASFSEA
jgi:hypothetical protein